MDRPLRLITASPLDAPRRTLEALLVVASQPLSVEDLAVAADDAVERVEDGARSSSASASARAQRHRARARRGRVRLPGSREEAEACARLFERPVERGLSRRRSRRSP